MTETDPRESNPNASGAHGLEGEMGVSSERTGPFGGSDPADEGIQGTGTVGTAAEKTEGTMSTERKHPEEPAEGRRDDGQPGADSTSNQEEGSGTSERSEESDDEEDPGSRQEMSGPEMDDTQSRATQEWREQHPAATDPPAAETAPNDPDRSIDTEATPGKASIDRTVGEHNTAEVPSHQFDRRKNPGHTHG